LGFVAVLLSDLPVFILHFLRVFFVVVGFFGVTTTFFFLTSTETCLERPWLKLCFTVPEVFRTTVSGLRPPELP
jgi:hypothetical protein